MFLFWRSLYTHLHMLWDHAFVYIQFSIQVFVYYATAVYYTTLSEQLSSDLCFPAERIHYLEGSIEQTMPKHTTHTVEDTKGNLGSSDIMDDICSQKMQPFYGRWKQDTSCSPGSPTLIPGVILHYISAARKAFAIEPLMSEKQRFFKACEFESGAHQLRRDNWKSVKIKISEWDSLKTSRPFVFTHLCIV